MDTINTSVIIEMAGYLGSVLVVVSMLMSSVVKLRIINTIGSSISATYALIIHSYPLALMNACLVIINIYNLVKLLKPDNSYNLVKAKTDDTFFEYFLNYYKNDIQNFFPEKNINISLADTAYIIYSGPDPAGILLGKAAKDGTFRIFIDYTTPAYRNFSVGKFLYSVLPEHGIKKLVYSEEPGRHEPYLKKMGFTIENSDYVKYL